MLIQTLTDLGSLIHQRTNVPSKLMLIQVISICFFYQNFKWKSFRISKQVIKPSAFIHNKVLYLTLDKMSSEFLQNSILIGKAICFFYQNFKWKASRISKQVLRPLVSPTLDKMSSEFLMVIADGSKSIQEFRSKFRSKDQMPLPIAT